MGVGASWANSLHSEYSRGRHAMRTQLALVPGKPRLAAPAPVLAPADYASAHERADEPRRALEVGVLLASAIALHAAVAWALVQPETTAPVRPPQVPIEVVITRPPVIPPVAALQPPKPRPVQHKAPAPKPAPRVVETPSPDAITVPPAPPVVESAPAPVVEKVTEASADADYLQNPAPQYPALALRQGWEGTAWLRILVRPDGTPGQIDLQQSSGRKTLDDAALAAVRGWRFVPATRGDTAIEGWVSVPIEFKLSK
jgi:protein TonB